MKFKEYVAAMQKAIDDNPALGEMTTIYAADDEGNAFYELHNDIPAVGIWDGEYGGEFISTCPVHGDKEYLKEREEEGEDNTPNAVCIN